MRQRAPKPGLFIRFGLLLALGLSQTSHVQESSGKPEAPAPKTVPFPIRPPKHPLGDSASKEIGREPEPVADLSALAAAVAAFISSADCQPKSCTVLVTDFTFPDGSTSVYGKQLADTLSRQLTNKEYKLRVIDRQVLQTFLAKERVPAQSEHRAIVHWISEALGARFIVFGATEKTGNGLVNISSQLIDTENKDWCVYRAIINPVPLNTADDLEPIEPFAPLPEIPTSLNGEKVERPGTNGTTTPSCTYMPNPPYSDGARKLKISGPVTAEGVVNSEGRLENVRIVRGLPGGLNETVVATVRTWRCHPALKDGKPVPVLVPFTVTFLLY